MLAIFLIAFFITAIILHERRQVEVVPGRAKVWRFTRWFALFGFGFLAFSLMYTH